jgi:hypothetical protein
MHRICSFGCILAVTIWSTHDFEAQKLAIVEILWHGSEASVERAYTRPFYGECYFGPESRFIEFSQFRVVALSKPRGAIQVFYNQDVFTGIATRPLHDSSASPEVLLSKDWAYFVSRGGEEGLAVYCKLFRQGACPKDSAGCVREWMKLGHYRTVVRGGT